VTAEPCSQRNSIGARVGGCSWLADDSAGLLIAHKGTHQLTAAKLFLIITVKALNNYMMQAFVSTGNV
jgi:hypothetical protein